MYKLLCQNISINELGSILDVGITADRTQKSSIFFEKMYPYPDRITALSDQDASWIEKEEEYNGIKFVKGNGMDLPFPDNHFDLVFSSAVIEHVGNSKNQIVFISECFRVSKRHVFITTPNRWHPIEFHTVLPLIHWLPKNVYRNILKAIGKDFFANENHLNLLIRKDLAKLVKNINSPQDFIIKHIRFLWIPSNLILITNNKRKEK